MEVKDGASYTSRLLAFALALLLSYSAALCQAAPDRNELDRAVNLGVIGHFRDALEVLDEANLPSQTQNTAIETDIALLKVDLLRRLGALPRAQRELKSLQSLPENSAGGNATLTAQIYQQQALIHYQSGAFDQAGISIAAALELQSQLPASLQSKLLNDDGLIRQKTGDVIAAIERFDAAAGIAADTDAETIYRLNLARAMLEDGRLAEGVSVLDSIAGSLTANQSSAASGQRLALADLYRKAVNELGANANYRHKAFEQLEQASSNSVSNARIQSLAKGTIAELYFDERQFDSAVHYARLALQYAQKTDANDLLYRWEWLLGRAFNRLDDHEASIEAYGRSVTYLRTVRGSLEMADSNTFTNVTRPLYSEYADVLLSHSATMADSEAQQEMLRHARNALEEVKVAEVQDYFDEQCVGDQSVVLDQLAGDAAVLYPVMLEERLELLLTTGSGVKQITVPVQRANLVSHIRDFRLHIEADTGSDDYLRLAQQLHNWLIHPMEQELKAAGITTLVIVPDGALRTIPLAALHDGSSYLIERYALAVTPGLTLLDPKPFSQRNYSTLAGGVSESVQGFDALPGVDLELNALRSMLDANVLQNDAFTLSRVKSELTQGDYSVVHFATHGQFGGSYKDSFLLTHDDKFLINDLGRAIQSRPTGSVALELLVLSACETAAGDDRAALGLAGVALKAGARSALATLWEVDDKATLEIISEFYAQLAKGSVSKARSLQRAQVKLVQNNLTNHPSKWAPFLLIGNWL